MGGEGEEMGEGKRLCGIVAVCKGMINHRPALATGVARIKLHVASD